MSENNQYLANLPGFFEIPENLRTKGTVLYAVEHDGFTKLKTSCGQVCLQGRGKRAFKVGLDDFLGDFTTRADKEGVAALLVLDNQTNEAMKRLDLIQGKTHLIRTQDNTKIIEVYELM